MDNPIEEIKNRLDIVEVIGSYIKLQKTGINYRAVCPFHSEKKPSFFVSPSRQIWRCFGCGLGGDVFKFVMEIEGVEFGDALRILAQRAGVELKKNTPEYKKLKSERQNLYQICELATRFFEKQLQESKAGKEARKYLLARGISQDSIKKWRIGYAPDVWQGLSDFLTSKDYKREEIEKAGLALTSEKGSFYDRFRGRIVFPIFDLHSQVIGFGGRVFKEKDKKEIAKYVNTPNTILYNKSRVLYGLNKAKVEIRKKEACVLVEGYTDVILLSQAGFENVVSASGTALTAEQLKILKRYTENLTLAFDMDLAGDSATKRGIELAQALGFNIRVLRLPQGADPADVVSKDPKEWEEILKKGKSILEFYFESTLSKFDKKTPEGKKEISRVLLEVIKRIPNSIEQNFWIQQLARELEVSEEAIIEELKKVKVSKDYFGPEYGLERETDSEKISSPPQKSRKELLEEHLLSLIIKEEGNLKILKEQDLKFFSQKASKVLSCLRKQLGHEDFSAETKEFLDYLALKADLLDKEMDYKKEFEKALFELKHFEIKSKLDEVSKKIKKAEEEKDAPQLEELLKEFNYYLKTLKELENCL